MKNIAIFLIFLFCASDALAQNSITVSISVTDLGGQTWNNGTYIANFVGPANVSWPGGTVTRSFSGSLSATGTATQSLANNNTITPSPTFWTFTVCPAAGVSSGCFTTGSISVTTPAQAVSITPPAISIPASSTNSPIGAYADAEITSNLFVGAAYNQISNQGVTPRVCQTVSGTTCTSWSSVGGIVPITGPLSFSATAYGVKADAVYVLDATWTNGQVAVTCPNNDCNFSAATDNGKLCWGINAGLGTNTLPLGTLTVTGAQSATCSTATGSVAASGTFAWCSDDTNAWITLRNAYYASQRAAFIEGPGGHTCVTKAPLRDTRPNTTNAAMWAPSFQSPSGMTIFIPTPTFDFTTCNNPIAGMNGGCFWDTAPTGATSQSNLPQYAKVQNFGVNGLGFNAVSPPNGVSAAAFQRVEGSNIWLWDWGAGVSGFFCANAVAPNSFYNLNINSCGGTGLTTGGGFSNGITWLVTSYIGGGGMTSLLNVGGTGSITVSKGSYYLTGCATQCITVQNGNQLTMDGDEINGASGNQYIDLLASSTLFMINGVKMVATNNNGHSILTRSGSKAYIRGSSISETGTGGIAFNVNLVPGGSIINEGDNTIVGIDQTALASSMIVLSAGWGTTATTSNFSGSASSNPTKFSFQVNSSGTGQAANPTMAFTYPSAGSTPTLTCKQSGGTQALAQISGENTATATTMTLTYNGTPVAGNNVVVTCTGALQ